MRVLFAALSFSTVLCELWTPPDAGEWLPRSRFLPRPALDEISAECRRHQGPSVFLTLREALSEAQQTSRGHQILVARNGENRGVLVDFQEGCLYSAAYAASEVLGTEFELQVEADEGLLYAPLFLYNMQGLPVGSEQDLELGSPVRVAFLVLPDEVFVWPGVEAGYRWSASGFSFETKSISPKVILIGNLLSEEYTRGAIEQGGAHLVASPETALLAGRRTRTSSSAGLGVRTKTAQHIHLSLQQVVRLPYHHLAEQPMLLHYIEGQLYRKHYDFYHFFLDELPRERVRPAQAARNYAQWIEYINVHLSENEDLRSVLAQRTPQLIPPKYYDEQDALTRQFEGAMAALSFAAWDTMYTASDSASWKEWLRTNLDRGARGLFKALIGSLPEALAIGQAAWEAEALGALSAFTTLDPARRAELERLVRIPDYLRGANSVLLSNKRDRDSFHCAASTQSIDMILPWEGRLPANRFATVLFYLNDVVSGGHTVFPKGLSPPGADGLTELEERVYRVNASECVAGLAIRPTEGAAALFYSLTGAGEQDWTSEHTGCPPVDPPGLEKPQEKWAINGFVWNIPMVPEFCPKRSKMCWDKD